MNLRLTHGGALVAVCAAAVLTISACSDDSSGSAESSPGADPSSSSGPTAAELDARAEDLMLPESDFPGGGTYIVMDKAAIDADDKSDPEVTPTDCADISDDSEASKQFDRAKVKYDLEGGSSIETQVILGQDGTFEELENDIASCPAMTMRDNLDDGSQLVAEMENSLEDVQGTTVPAKTVVSTGTATVGADALPLTIRSTGAYVDGVTVSVDVTLIGDEAGSWGSADEAAVVDLLNKQIAIVQDAANA
jgi:hypothetical protein